MSKKARAKAKGKNDDDDEIYEEGEEGEWVEERAADDPVVEPQAVPGAALLRTTTVTSANPTPPTNVPCVYQGTPPTTAGLTPAQAPAPDVVATNIFLFSDPLNGATQGPAPKPDTIVAVTGSGGTAGSATPRAAELAGKAEFSGLTSAVYSARNVAVAAAAATVIQRGVVTPAYSETPNLSHPSYGT